MKLILHAGAHKTGTTSIQAALVGAAETLQKYGILYPVLPDWEHNHTGLISGLAGSESNVGRLVRVKLQALGLSREDYYRKQIESIRLQVERGNPSVVILSSEAFFNTEKYEVPRIVDDLGFGRQDVQVLVYLREPASHYLSLIQQKLKHSSTFKGPSSIKFWRTLSRYEDWFGGNMRVRPLEALNEGVIADIADVLGLPRTRLDQPERRNVSISAESMSVLQSFRQAAFPGEDDNVIPDCNRLFRELRRVESIIGCPRPKLRDSVVQKVQKSCAVGLEWLVDRFPEFQTVWRVDSPEDIRWNTPDRPLLVEDVCHVDQYLRSRILIELLLRQWQFQRPPT